jgi:hypothetical protein
MGKSLLLKYQGPDGGRRLIEVLQAQQFVQEKSLAVELARSVKLEKLYQPAKSLSSRDLAGGTCF